MKVVYIIRSKKRQSKKRINISDDRSYIVEVQRSFDHLEVLEINVPDDAARFIWTSRVMIQ